MLCCHVEMHGKSYRSWFPFNLKLEQWSLARFVGASTMKHVNLNFMALAAMCLDPQYNVVDRRGGNGGTGLRTLKANGCLFR